MRPASNLKQTTCSSRLQPSIAGRRLLLLLAGLALLLPEGARADALVHTVDNLDANVLSEVAKEGDDVVENSVRGVRRRGVGTALGTAGEADRAEGGLDIVAGSGDGKRRTADLGHVADDESGKDHAHNDALGLDLGCERRVPGLQAGLGARVSGQEGGGDTARHGAEVENERLGSALSGTLDHAGENGAGELERPRDVGLDDLVDLGGGSLGEGDGHLVRRTDVVDEDTEVDLGRDGRNTGNGGVETGSIGSVGDHSLGGNLVLGLELGGELVERTLATADEDKTVTLRGELASELETNAGGTASDQGVGLGRARLELGQLKVSWA